MFFKLNVSIIDCKGTYYYFMVKGLRVNIADNIINCKGIYYYFMVKGLRVNMPDNITNCDQERLEKKVRRIGF